MVLDDDLDAALADGTADIVVVADQGNSLAMTAQDVLTAAVTAVRAPIDAARVAAERTGAGDADATAAATVVARAIAPVAIDVVDLGVAFACGGSIKYLCGGPGAGWLYVRKDLIDRFEPRATGWFANAHPFAFTMPAQTYAEGIGRYLTGTPAIAALYQARAGQQIVAEIGAAAIREKSLALTARAIAQVDACGFTLKSPRADAQRGGSVVFDFVGAADVARELNRRRFFCDHRPAAGVRIAPHFYTKAEEIDLFFAELRKIRG